MIYPKPVNAGFFEISFYIVISACGIIMLPKNGFIVSNFLRNFLAQKKYRIPSQSMMSIRKVLTSCFFLVYRRCWIGGFSNGIKKKCALCTSFNI